MATDYDWHREKDVSDYIFEWIEIIETCKSEIENFMKLALHSNNWTVYENLHEYLKLLTKLGVDKSNEMEKIENNSDIEYLQNNLLYAMDDAYKILLIATKYYNSAHMKSNIPRYHNTQFLPSSTLNTAAQRLNEYQQENMAKRTISQPSIARLQIPTTASRARSQNKFVPRPSLPIQLRPTQRSTRKQIENEFQKYQPRIIETQLAGKELLQSAQAIITKSTNKNDQNIQKIMKYSSELSKELYNLQTIANSTKPAGALNTIRAVTNQMNKLNSVITDYQKIRAQRVASQPLVSQNRLRLQKQTNGPKISKSTSFIRPPSTLNPQKLNKIDKKQADFIYFTSEWKKFKKSVIEKVTSLQQEAIQNQQTNPNNKNHQIYLTFLNKVKTKFQSFANQQEQLLKLAKDRADVGEYYNIVSAGQETFGKYFNLDKERQRYLVRCSAPQATENNQLSIEFNKLYKLWENKTKLALNYLTKLLEKPASSKQLAELDKKINNLRELIDSESQQIKNSKTFGNLKAIKQLIQLKIENIENIAYEKYVLNFKTPNTVKYSQRKPLVNNQNVQYQQSQQRIKRNEIQLARQNAIKQSRLDRMAEIEAKRIIPVPPPTKSRKDYTANELKLIADRKNRLVNTIRKLQTIGKARSTTADIERAKVNQFGGTAKSLKLPERIISTRKTMTREQVKTEKRRLDKQHNDYIRTAKKIGTAKRRLFDEAAIRQTPIGTVSVKQAKIKAAYQPNSNFETPINYESRPRVAGRRLPFSAASYRRDSIKLGNKGYYRSQIRKIKNQIFNEMKNQPKRKIDVPKSLNALMPSGFAYDKPMMDGIFWDLYSDDSLKSLQIERMLNNPERKKDYIVGVRRMYEYEPKSLDYIKAKLLHKFEGYDERIP